MQMPPAGSSGFSLVEAIVALTIVALLASVASESFRYATKTRASIVSLATKFEDDETLRRVLERTVSSSRHWDSDRLSDTLTFHGSRNDLSFAAPLPKSLYRGAPGEYRLTLTESHDWVLVWRIAATSANIDRYGGVAALAKNVSEVSIDYFGPVSLHQSEWVTSWDRKELPQLVRFRWREGSEINQLMVRLFGARTDCSPSNVIFARDCLE